MRFTAWEFDAELDVASLICRRVRDQPVQYWLIQFSPRSLDVLWRDVTCTCLLCQISHPYLNIITSFLPSGCLFIDFSTLILNRRCTSFTISHPACSYFFPLSASCPAAEENGLAWEERSGPFGRLYYINHHASVRGSKRDKNSRFVVVNISRLIEGSLRARYRCHFPPVFYFIFFLALIHVLTSYNFGFLL